MVQMKPYFLNLEKPPAKRLASVQKCFRTTDINAVGDDSHLTFFEMLGNFSIGDYFKKEAITWAWEFVTEWLNIPPERLWITVYLNDDQAVNLWQSVGVPEVRIRRFGEEDNFWGPVGETGPCGPCSEIHYDFGRDKGCDKDECGPNCDCGRFCEIWNLVFMQFNQDKNGNRIPLPKPNIDTGMGLERTAAVLQNTPTLYETDLFEPYLDFLGELSKKHYGESDEVSRAMRIVVEHCRGLAFLIADGVLPANDGRGYILRRLIRRAALFGRLLGLEKQFLGAIVAKIVDTMSRAYPELREKRSFILNIINSEEERFGLTLMTGLDLLKNLIDRAVKEPKRQIDGFEAFRLYDTFGFPIELTLEIAEQQRVAVDLPVFNRAMEDQRQKARSSHKFELEEESVKDELEMEATNFVGYENLSLETKVINILCDGKKIDRLKEGNNKATVVLAETPFYAEMGGQIGDTGSICNSPNEFVVTNTSRLPSGIVLHSGQIKTGKILTGDRVIAIVDIERRFDIARNHTATHLLQYALRRVLGKQVEQRGSVVAQDRLRFDFSHLKQMTPDDINKVEQIVNNEIRHNLPVFDDTMTYKEAIGIGATALFGEKYGEEVRVVKVGNPPISIELCGGTHIKATGEIGLFQITGETSIGAGLRRIEAITGREAEIHVRQQLSNLYIAADVLHVSPESLPKKITNLLAEVDKHKRRNEELEQKIAFGEAEALLNRVEEVKGFRLVTARIVSASPGSLRLMADYLRDKLGTALIVLATIVKDNPFFLAAVTDDLITQGYNAGKIIKEVTKIAGGDGGGKPGLAQGGGRNKEKIDQALKRVKDLL
jgi:alanyl-tRNA synthetase